MPFQISKAAAQTRRVKITFDRYGQSVTVWYNAGQKYRQYQKLSQQLEREYNELNRRLASDSISDEDNEKLLDAAASARRRLADNICTVIEKWDLEAKDEITLDDVKANMAEDDAKRFEGVSGEGNIPVDGAWLDALPLPDEFIIDISSGIMEDFDSGGAAGKALSAVS